MDKHTSQQHRATRTSAKTRRTQAPWHAWLVRPLHVLSLLLIVCVSLMFQVQTIFAQAATFGVVQSIIVDGVPYEDPATVVEVVTGKSFQIKLQYTCFSTIGPSCNNMQIEMQLPDTWISTAAVDVDFSAVTSDIASTSYDPGTRTATWNFNPAVSSGDTGELELQIQFVDDGSCTDGTQVQPIPLPLLPMA